jgi:hypothetical protein
MSNDEQLIKALGFRNFIRLRGAQTLAEYAEIQLAFLELDVQILKDEVTKLREDLELAKLSREQWKEKD